MIALILAGLISLGVYMSKSEAQEEPKFTHRLDPIFYEMAKKHGIKDWLWLKAIAKQESDLGDNPRVKAGKVSYDGLSWGVMQIAPNRGSAKEIELKGPLNIELLNNERYSIERAAMLIRYLQDKYFPEIRKIFLAYNQGEKNTDNGYDYTVKHTPGGYDNAILKWYEKFKKEIL